MHDCRVIPFQRGSARRHAPPGVLSEAAAIARGALFALAVVVLGSFLVAVALLLGVVGAPILAVALAWLLLRHARPSRAPAARRLRIASA